MIRRAALGRLPAASSLRAAVLTIINNTATTPIAGTFTNLPEGAQVFGRRAFQVSYKGGDGNDLTLTVVPSK